MTYTVTIHTQAGETEKRVFDAPSRHDLFEILKKHGINDVVRVEEVVFHDNVLDYRKIAAIVIATVLILVVLCIVVVFPGSKGTSHSIPKNETSHSQPQKRQKVISQPLDTCINSPEAPDSNARPQRVGEVLNGYVMLPSGRLHKRSGIITNDANKSQFKLPYEVFDFGCENEIACLLDLPPGAGLVGTPIYGGNFKSEFLKSLEQPIIIEENDSDYVKQLKREVREAKVEMKAALDRGEDIEKIMIDARKECQELAIYKRQLEENLNDMINNASITEDDIDDCIKAINIMLERKGIAPLDLGPISKRKLKRILFEKGVQQ